MSNQKINRTMRVSLSFLSVLVAIISAGCGGGMVGTGTGPGNDITDSYQMKNLPERISPDIPKTQLKGEELKPSQPENQNVIDGKMNFLSRMDDIDSGKSFGWQRMNDDLVTASLTRANAQISSTIIDIAFDTILMRCEDQLMDCTIPSDQIKVKLTQDVINRLIEIATDLVDSLPPHVFNEDERRDSVAVIREQFTLLRDSEVVLGETHYSQLDGAPYDHSVRTFFKRKAVSDEEFTVLFWKDEEFSARWHDDGSVAQFVIKATGFPLREYFYQNKTPSELVISSFVSTDDDELQSIDFHVKLIANDPSNAGVLVEVAQVRNIPVVVNDEPSLNVSFGLVQGQMDNSGGFSIFDGISFNIADTAKAYGYSGLRESFDNVGNLIARTECNVRDDIQGIVACSEEDFVPVGPTGSLLTDSPYYFQSGQFDSLVAVQDVIRWTVEGLPVDIKRIAVVSADPAIELSERELLCRGFQYASDDIRTFCRATDEQLSSTVVLELVDGKPGRVIPSAKLVQIQ